MGIICIYETKQKSSLKSTLLSKITFNVKMISLLTEKKFNMNINMSVFKITLLDSFISLYFLLYAEVYMTAIKKSYF